MTMVWGIDSATRCTGITAGTGERMPAVGVWEFDHCGDDYGLLLHEFGEKMNELASRLGAPTVVIYEAPIPPRPHDKLMTLRKLYSMGPYLELWCRDRGVICQEEPPRALKKALTGNHLAKKPAMVAMCRQLGVRLPKGPAAEDAADSFAAWYIGVQHHARQHVTKWDQALYSHRGFLA